MPRPDCVQCSVAVLFKHAHAPLQELCLPYEVTAADLDEADPSSMLMLVTYLFTALPQLLPRATLDFTCKLAEQQVRCHCHGTWVTPSISSRHLLSTRTAYSLHIPAHSGHMVCWGFTTVPYSLVGATYACLLLTSVVITGP